MLMLNEYNLKDRGALMLNIRFSCSPSWTSCCGRIASLEEAREGLWVSHHGLLTGRPRAARAQHPWLKSEADLEVLCLSIYGVRY